MPTPPSTPPAFESAASSILGLIGGTPMVRIQRMCPNPKVTLMAKLEGFNPTGSKRGLKNSHRHLHSSRCNQYFRNVEFVVFKL